MSWPKEWFVSKLPYHKFRELLTAHEKIHKDRYYYYEQYGRYCLRFNAEAPVSGRAS